MRKFNAEAVPAPNSEVLAKVGDFLKSLPEAPVDFEIGGGQGLFAIHHSRKYPLRNLISVERTRNKFKAMNHRFFGNGSPGNLLPLNADAICVLTHSIKDAQIENLYILYPNPYPKSKHANRRWGNSTCLDLFATRIKPDGKLIICTNLNWYAEECAKNIPQFHQFKLITRRKVSGYQKPRTHFEKKYLARGEHPTELIFVRLS